MGYLTLHSCGRRLVEHRARSSRSRRRRKSTNATEPGNQVAGRFGVRSAGRQAEVGATDSVLFRGEADCLVVLRRERGWRN